MLELLQRPPHTEAQLGRDRPTHSEHSTGTLRGAAVTPSERTMRARLAAHAMHSKYDSRETSKPGRDAFLARFEREVDPDGALDATERARRAEHARKAYFTRLALQSAKARRGPSVEDRGDPIGVDVAQEPPKSPQIVQDAPRRVVRGPRLGGGS